MSSSSVLLFIISLQAISAYWLSQNRLTYFDAADYCDTICNSALASLHSSSDHAEIISLIGNEDTISNGFQEYQLNAWIGLQSTTGGSVHAWTDGTAFNYGNTFSSPPWESGLPINNDGHDCVTYFVPPNGDFDWGDEDCDAKHRFICNSCEGVLEKYILIEDDIGSTYSNALDYCENTHGTSLASIHSVDDFEATQLLCTTVTTDCWIGLNRLDNQDAFVSMNDFEWSDGTSFTSGDYGYNSGVSGITPWANLQGSQPNNAVGNDQWCVELDDEQDYKWNDDDCHNDNFNHFICNKPNEFFYPKHWSELSSQDPFIFSNGVAHNFDNGIAVISRKRWTNNNWPLRIEYVFTIHNVNDRAQNSESGVVLYHKNQASSAFDECDYYFIGIQIRNNTDSAYLVMEDIYNGNPLWRIISDTPVFTVEYSIRQYQINIDLDVLNGEVSATFDIEGLMTNRFTANDQYSDTYGYTTGDKYIGIKNANADIESKSLFISGTPEYNYGSFPLRQTCGFTGRPTAAPTPSPTDLPSKSPSDPPTSDPTDLPTFIPTAMPSENPSASPTTASPTTAQPSTPPSKNPTQYPSSDPTVNPTTATPTTSPTTAKPTLTDYPTDDPTTDPTLEPTMNPTNKPTDIPTRSFEINKYGVKISITLKYKLNANISDTDIRYIFINITKDIITDLTTDLAIENCIASKDYNISVAVDEVKDQTTINATVFVCDDETQKLLTTEFNDNLLTEVIDKTNIISIVEVNSTTIITGANPLHTESDGSASDITTTEDSNNYPATGDNQKKSDILIYVYIGIGAFSFLLLVACAFVYLWNKNKNLEKQMTALKGNSKVQSINSVSTPQKKETLTVTTADIDLDSAISTELPPEPVRMVTTSGISSAGFGETPGNMLSAIEMEQVGSVSEGTGTDEGTDEANGPTTTYLDDDEDDGLWGDHNDNDKDNGITPMGPIVTDDGSGKYVETLK